jgi:hypothetical protein
MYLYTSSLAELSRVTENWKKYSQPCKNVKTVTREVTKNTECLLLLPRGKKDLEARWRDGAQHEEDTPREVLAGILGVHHQVNKQVRQECKKPPE